MRVALLEKKMAITSPIKEIEIEGMFEDYYQDGEPSERYWGRNIVNEELLINNIPSHFFGSTNPAGISVSVEMEIDEESGRSVGTRGQTNMEIFSADERRLTLLLCRD